MKDLKVRNNFTNTICNWNKNNNEKKIISSFFSSEKQKLKIKRTVNI
jgi:hypothetical protein